MLLFEADFTNLHWASRHGGQRRAGSLPLDLDAAAWTELETLFAQAETAGFVLTHGGEVFTRPATRLDKAALADLAAVIAYLPGPNQAIFNLAQGCLQRWPALPQTVYCQTALFAELPPAARVYALPYALTKNGYRRFGGGGLAHAWAWQQASQRLPGIHRLVSVHITDIPSVAAIQDGRAVETSQGYSPVEGLPGKTSSGDVDPSIVLLLAENGLRPSEVERLLTRDSGFSALAGRACHPAELIGEQVNHPLARQALFYGLLKAIGAAAASLGGMDALVFSGEALEAGLGFLREICTHLTFCGLQPNQEPTAQSAAWALSKPGSPVQALALEVDLFDCINHANKELL